MYSQRIRSLMGSMEPPTIHQSHARFGGTTTSTVSSRQTKATSSTDGSNHQAAISRRLPGRQSLSNVAVTGTALKTRTRPALTKYLVWICYRVATHQLNLYFPGRERDSTCKKHLVCTRATRRIASYTLRLCRCVEDVGIHHHAVDKNGGITHSIGLAQASSIVEIDT